jgi:hypothetical protein
MSAPATLTVRGGAGGWLRARQARLDPRSGQKDARHDAFSREAAIWPVSAAPPRSPYGRRFAMASPT